MNTWLTTQIGTEAASIVSYVALFVAAIIAICLIILIVKRLNKGTYVVGGKNRQPRLSVRDAAPIDNKRQLVLVKRDNVEHLILIGGPADLVIERNITDTSINAVNLGSIEGEQPQDISAMVLVPNENTASLTSDKIDEKDSSIKFPSNNNSVDNNSLRIAENNAPISPMTIDANAARPKIPENDQTIFANLAINKSTSKKSVELAHSDSPKAMNESPYQGITVGEQEASDATDYIETNDSRYVEFDGAEDVLRHTDSFEADSKIDEDAIQNKHINQSSESLSRQELDVSNTQPPVERSIPISQTVKNKPNISSTIFHDDFAEKSDQKIASGKSGILEEVANGTASAFQDTDAIGSVAKSHSGDSYTVDAKDNHLQSEISTLGTHSPTIAPHSNRQSLSSKEHFKGETPAKELEALQDQKSKSQVPSDVPEKKQPIQQNSTNPFAKAKPINPYKVMKAAGAFGGMNHNVNFRPSLANAPVNKGNSFAGESATANNSLEQTSAQNSNGGSQVVQKNADVLSNGGQLADNQTSDTPVAQLTVNGANNIASLHKPLQYSTTETTVTSNANLQSDNSSGVQKDTTDMGVNQQADKAYGDIAGRAIAQNITNKPQLNSERTKTVLSTDKTQVPQERPIAQRTVPQGMLRPPLMAKPRNASSAPSTNQQGRSTVKVTESPLKPASDMDRINIGVKNNVVGLQSIKTAKEGNTDTATLSNAAQPKAEKQIVDSATINTATDQTLKEPIKASSQNKVGSLQKFSLQLLEPQHILDKPIRQDDNVVDKKTTSFKAPTAREEEEFDRHLQSELVKPTEK